MWSSSLLAGTTTTTCRIMLSFLNRCALESSTEFGTYRFDRYLSVSCPCEVVTALDRDRSGSDGRTLAVKRSLAARRGACRCW